MLTDPGSTLYYLDMISGEPLAPEICFFKNQDREASISTFIGTCGSTTTGMGSVSNILSILNHLQFGKWPSRFVLE